MPMAVDNMLTWTVLKPVGPERMLLVAMGAAFLERMSHRWIQSYHLVMIVL